MPEEEENEKRNRARELVRSINNNSLKVEQNNNYNNSISDEEEKRNRAREIVRSINSSKKANTDINTEIEKNNTGINTTVEDYNTNKTTKELPRFSNNRTITEEEANIPAKERNKIDLFDAGAFSDGYQVGDVTKTVTGTISDITGDFASGAASIIENIIDIGANMLATVQDVCGFDEAAKDIRNWANTNYSEKFGNAVANVMPVGILHNIMNGTFGENIFDSNSFEENSLLGSTSDQIVNLVGYTAGMAAGGKVLDAVGKGADITIQLGSHTLNLPKLAITGGMAGGLAEANAAGDDITELQRWSKAITGGLIEGGSEGMFGALGIGGNDITDKWIQTAAGKVSSSASKMLVKLGIECAGEATEEFVSYAGNYLADNLINNNLGKGDLSTEWDWGEVGEQMALAFASTAISSGSTNLINTNSAIKAAEKQLNRKLTNDEKGQVTQAVIDETLNDEIYKMQAKDNSKVVIDEDNLQEFYVTVFDKEGNIAKIVQNNGKPIPNTNSKINAKPVIIKNAETNYYNVIDAETGVMLDTTPYESLASAKGSFDNKMNTLSDTSINEINNRISNVKLMIDEEIGKNIKEQYENRNMPYSNEYYKNNTTQTNLVDDTANLNNETTSDMYNNEETLKNENKSDYNNAQIFRQGLEKFKSRNYASHDNIVVLEETPQWLYNKGYEYEQPIVLNMNKLETIMKEPKGTVNGKNQHGITMDLIEQLPEAIRNPLNVIKNPKYNNKFVVITELTDQYGDIVVVPIEMNTRGNIEGIETDVNKIASIYGKEFYDLVKNDKIASYMEQNKNNIVYDIDTYNKSNTLRDSRLQLPLTPKGITSNTSITQDNKAVKKNSKHNVTKSDTKAQQDIEGNEVHSMKKYNNVTELLKDKQAEAEKNFETKANISKVKSIDNIDIDNMSEADYIKLSKKVFSENNNKRTFKNENSNQIIKVILRDIKESAFKAYDNKYQSKYKKEHLYALSQIGDIITNATESSIDNEKKGRNQNKSWKYYTLQTLIDNRPFLIEFDTVQKDDGYHFRLQRLVELNIKKGDITSALTNKQVGANSR